MFRPSPLNLLAANPADALHEVQRVSVVALLLVGTKMILRNRETKFPRTARQGDLEVSGEAADALEETDGPLAYDVVGDNQRGELAVNFQGGGNYVIHVAISGYVISNYELE